MYLSGTEDFRETSLVVVRAWIVFYWYLFNRSVRFEKKWSEGYFHQWYQFLVNQCSNNNISISADRYCKWLGVLHKGSGEDHRDHSNNVYSSITYNLPSYFCIFKIDIQPRHGSSSRGRCRSWRRPQRFCPRPLGRPTTRDVMLAFQPFKPALGSPILRTLPTSWTDSTGCWTFPGRSRVKGRKNSRLRIKSGVQVSPTDCSARAPLGRHPQHCLLGIAHRLMQRRHDGRRCHHLCWRVTDTDKAFPWPCVSRQIDRRSRWPNFVWIWW